MSAYLRESVLLSLSFSSSSFRHSPASCFSLLFLSASMRLLLPIPFALLYPLIHALFTANVRRWCVCSCVCRVHARGRQDKRGVVVAVGGVKCDLKACGVNNSTGRTAAEAPEASAQSHICSGSTEPAGCCSLVRFVMLHNPDRTDFCVMSQVDGDTYSVI